MSKLMFREGDVLSHKLDLTFGFTVSEISEHFYHLINKKGHITNVSHPVVHKLFKLKNRRVKDTELARFMYPEFEECEEGWILI